MPPHESPRVCLPASPTPGRPQSPVSAWSPPPMLAASTMSSPAPSTLLPSHAPTAWLQQRALSKGGEAPSIRVVIKPRHLSALPPPVLPTCDPISHCTCSRAPAPLALFTTGQPLHKCVTHHILTAKSFQPTAEPISFAGLCKTMHPAEIDGFAYLCQALTQMSGLQALLVLNPSTGKFLKHCQLRCDPATKPPGTCLMPLNSDGYAKA
jgi:hypothetical protein